MRRSERRAHGTLLLVGTVIGAGIFGVPAMIGAWGFIPATFGFFAITLVALGTHLMFVEAIVHYAAKARIAGYARHYLGREAGFITGVMHALAVFGSNLAYIILGGEFFAVMANMLGFHYPVLTWQIIFWFGGALTVFFGLKLVERVQNFLTWILIAVIIVFVIAVVPRMDPSLVVTWPTRFTFEPYGVFLFSLLGLTSLTEVSDLLNHNRNDLRAVTIRGSMLTAVLTYIFGASVWLASGGELGRSAADLVDVLPPGFAVMLPFFGFLAVATSFLTSALNLQNMFHYDFKFRTGFAWAIALGVPLALLFLTSRDFLSTIGFVGAVFGAGLSVVTVLMGREVLLRGIKPQLFSMMWWWRVATPLVLVALYVFAGALWFLIG